MSEFDPNPRRPATRQPWPVVLAVVLGLGTTLLAFFGVRSVNQERLEARFERETGNLAMAARQRIDSHMDVLFDLRDYFVAEGQVSRRAFGDFAEGQLKRHPGIQALEWVPVVARSERAAFEAAARREGLAGFRLTERAPDNRLVPVSDRPFYYPVFYVEPLAGNEAALGYAPAFHERNTAIAQARDTARPAATQGFSIVQSASDELGVAIFLPVYAGPGVPADQAARRARLRGLVEGVVLLEDMLSLSIEEGREAGIVVSLIDESAVSAQRTLVADPGGEGAEGLRRDVLIDVAGRPWRLSFRLADADVLEDGPFVHQWFVLVFGLAATGLLGGYLSSVLGQRARVEHLVIERTRALHEERELSQRAIEEVAVRRAELQQAKEIDRIKNNFASAVSHDLRTPLTSIMGYAEFLEDEIGGTLTDQQQGYVLQIMRGARRLEHLVDDLLDFARLDAGTFKLRREPADLGREIAEVAESLGPQIEEAGLTLEVECRELPLEAPMDVARIERVLFNLIHNAIKFTPRGGTIRVTAWAEDGQLRCEVLDTGIGIAADQLPKLFLRFSQLKSGSEKGGTGLGLSICRAIVEAHQGEIGVRSTPGQGSAFWFWLPAA